MLLPNGRGDPQLAIISGLEKNGEGVQAEPLLAEIEHIKFYLYTRYKKYMLNLILFVNGYHKSYIFNTLNTSKNTNLFLLNIKKYALKILKIHKLFCIEFF